MSWSLPPTKQRVSSDPHIAASSTLANKKRILVPGGGVEPPRAEARRILSPLRLPVPPSRRFVEVPDSTANFAFYFVATSNDKCETVLETVSVFADFHSFLSRP